MFENTVKYYKILRVCGHDLQTSYYRSCVGFSKEQLTYKTGAHTMGVVLTGHLRWRFMKCLSSWSQAG